MINAVSRFVLSVSIATGMFCAGWQSKPEPTEVRTTRLVLVDSSGREVASLGTDQGAVKLLMRHVGNTLEMVADKNGSSIAQRTDGFGADYIVSRSSSVFTLSRPNGSYVLCQAADEQSGISFFSAPFKRTAHLGADRTSAVMRLFSQKYYTVISTYDDFNAFMQDRQRESKTGGGLSK